MATPLYVIAGQSNAIYLDESGAIDAEITESGLGGTSIVAAGYGRGMFPSEEYTDFYPFEDGNPNTGELYREMVDGIQAQLDADPDVYFAGVLWLQGEEDAALLENSASYYDNLNKLFLNLVEEFGNAFEFVISLLSTYIGDADVRPGWDEVRLAQEDLAENHAQVSLIDPDAMIDVYEYTPEQIFYDEVHYTGTAYTWLADHFFSELETLPNHDPVAADDAYAFDEDADDAGADAANGVLANDSDDNGDTLSAALLTDVSHGLLNLNADGSFTYVPDADFHGVDSFTYIVSDGNGGTSTASVTLTVDPVNDDPVAVGDTAATDWQTAVNIDVLHNDGDTEGDSLSVASVTDGANGTVAIELDGTVSYTPANGFSGDDSFTYTVSDGNGGFDTASVQVSVAPPVVAEHHGTRDGERLDGDDGVNDLIFGRNGNDRLFGHGGNDTIRDGKGNDRMFGGAGEDMLIFKGGDVDRARGGSEADTFVFGNAFVHKGGTSIARILDYEIGIDRIDLDQGEITSVQERHDRVVLTVGPDGDKIVIKGVDDFGQLTFVDDLIG